jgi:hypothetical protein
MTDFNFDVLKTAWKKLAVSRAHDLRKIAPDFSNPEELYLKRVSEDDYNMVLQFAGFSQAVSNPESIPQAKRTVLKWLKRFSMDVRTMRSEPNTLQVNVAKELRFDEASISIYKRDPKSNKAKRYYKCIGGKKNGRRVANPDDCIGIPDFAKKMKFGIAKRAKAGQMGKSKKKTQLTSILAKRVRKANQRVKKARGF